MRRSILNADSPDPLALGQNERNWRRVGQNERSRRRSLLKDDPQIESVSMSTLVGIASAIENEAVQRYAMLAELMDQRGEPATAAAFRVMLEEERRHVVSVGRWAAAIGEPAAAAAAAAEQFEWHLPADLSSSWNDISASALLTPYRAFALAVDNEQRAFSFYAYLAAHADNAQIRAEAEKLGAEELRHASLLRRWRRSAWHRERRPARLPDIEIDSIDTLHRLLAQHESAIARMHGDLATRLRRIGDEQGALLLEKLLQMPTWPPLSVAPVDADDPNTENLAPDVNGPRHLLVDALKPLEALSETLEAVMRTTDGDLFDEAAKAMTNVVTRLARISDSIKATGDTR